ncbi:MAG: caspase family protein [Pseudomonadota bacterium]
MNNSRKKYALLIGNEKFDDSRLSKLLTPEKDVQSLKEALRDPDIGGFTEVEEVINGSMAEARRAVSRLFIDKSPDDIIVLYYSGHGLLDVNNRLYFATRESNLDDPATESLEASFVKDRMDDSRSKRQVVVLDCCHSGIFAEGARSANVLAISEDTFAPQGRGRYVMTASSAQQFAWEGTELKEGEDTGSENSIFTKCLVDGLTSGKASDDVSISVQQLYDYAHDNVVAQRSDMTPQLFVDKGAGNLDIALNPIRPLQGELIKALNSDNEYTRQGAVSELSIMIRSEDVRAGNSARGALRDRLDRENHYRVRNAIEDALRIEKNELPTTVVNVGNVNQAPNNNSQPYNRYLAGLLILSAAVISGLFIYFWIELADLKNKAALDGDQIVALRDRAQVAESSLATMEARATGGEEEAQRLTAELASAGKEIASLRARAETAEASLAAMEARATNAEKEVEGLTAELASAGKEIASLRARAETAETSLATMEARAINAEKEVEGLTANEASAGKEIASLRARAETAETSLATMEARATNTEKEVGKLTAKAASDGQEIVSLRARAQTAESALATMEARATNAEQAAEEFKAFVASAQTQELDLRSRLAEMEARATYAEEELEILRNSADTGQ